MLGVLSRDDLSCEAEQTLELPSLIFSGPLEDTRSTAPSSANILALKIDFLFFSSGSFLAPGVESTFKISSNPLCKEGNRLLSCSTLSGSSLSASSNSSKSHLNYGTQCTVPSRR